MFDGVLNTSVYFFYLSSIIWCGVDAAKDMVAVSITKPANNTKFLHLRSHFPALAFVKLAFLYSNLLVLWGVTHVQLPNTLTYKEKIYILLAINKLPATIWNLNYLFFTHLHCFHPYELFRNQQNTVNGTLYHWLHKLGNTILWNNCNSCCSLITMMVSPP